MTPLVGITLCLDDTGRWKANHQYQYLDVSYANTVEAAGGVPVYVPLETNIDRCLDSLDALLIPGGDDFLPPRPYPEGVEFRPAPQRQLDFDLRLLTRALERDKPVLAICYGMQLLALGYGGRLLYDIPSDRPESNNHQNPEPNGHHGLVLESGSQLEKALGPDPGPVNSRHHQGVADPGTGLVVSARADDGLIEAIEDPNRPFCVGVQWHPETLAGPHREGLFGAFIGACS